MKKYLSLLALAAIFSNQINVFSQIPPGYYNGTAGLTGTELRKALHYIISNHSVIQYDNLWQYYTKTDKKPNGKVWDMYSDIPGGNAPYSFVFGSDQCGQYTQEGDCFNREHSFPQSWFNNTTSPVYSDLFQVYPTDGWVNNKRANFPYGDVSNASWTSQNGSKLGSCANPGYSGTVFEPVDSFKGDFARTYFYIAVRYFMQDQTWPGSDMVNKAEPKPWALAVLKAWNILDPVSQKERNRNDSVYKYQHNRNPFIDKPQWVDSVWCGPTAITGQNNSVYKPFIYPNPATGKFLFSYNTEKAEITTVSVFSADGSKVKETMFTPTSGTYNGAIDLAGLAQGIYSITFVSESLWSATRIIVN